MSGKRVTRSNSKKGAKVLLPDGISTEGGVATPRSLAAREEQVLLDRAEREAAVAEALAVLLQRLEEYCEDKEVETRLVPYAVEYVMGQAVKVLGMVLIPRTAHWSQGQQGTWEADEEPVPPPIDTWARGAVPLKRRVIIPPQSPTLGLTGARKGADSPYRRSSNSPTGMGLNPPGSPSSHRVSRSKGLGSAQAPLAEEGSRGPSPGALSAASAPGALPDWTARSPKAKKPRSPKATKGKTGDKVLSSLESERNGMSRVTISEGGTRRGPRLKSGVNGKFEDLEPLKPLHKRSGGLKKVEETSPRAKARAMSHQKPGLAGPSTTSRAKATQRRPRSPHLEPIDSGPDAKVEEHEPSSSGQYASKGIRLPKEQPGHSSLANHHKQRGSADMATPVKEKRDRGAGHVTLPAIDRGARTRLPTINQKVG